jgi:hypothetical protein
MHKCQLSVWVKDGIIALLLACALLPRGAVAQECPQDKSELVINPPIVQIQGSGGETIFALENLPSKDVGLNLTAGPFISQTTHSVVPGTVAFSRGDGSREFPKKASREANPTLKATVANESAFGLATAKIFNNSRCIGTVKAVRMDPPPRFSAEWDGPANSPLRIEDGKPVRVAIKNNDDTAYSVTPVLSVDGQDSIANEVTIGPNGKAELQFLTKPGWFGLTTYLRPNAQQGRVELRPSANGFADSLGNRAVSAGSIPVSTQVAYFQPFFSTLVSTAVVFFVLLLGGLASVLTSSVLPNVLRRLSYKKRLRSLADATSGISVKVDSRLRVLLRLERNRLVKLVASSSALSTDTSDIFQQVDTGIAALGKRVTVAQRLDQLRNRFDRESLSCPPSISDKTDRYLQDAADKVRSKTLTDAMVDNANGSLDAAEKILNSLGDTEALGKDIAARHKELLARIATFPQNLVTGLQQDLPGIFSVRNQTYDDSHPVLASNFVEIDDSIARVNTALDYAYAQASTIEPTIQARLVLRYSKLIQLLGTRNWRSLRAARDLVQQIHQNIYPEDLIDDLSSGQAEITVDQQTARPYMPLEFCICFFRRPYNYGKALDELRCAWTFGDGLSETGWEVCHFYQDPALMTVTAEIPLSVPPLPGATVPVTPSSAIVATTTQPAVGLLNPAPNPGSTPPAAVRTVTFRHEIPVRDSRTSFTRQERFATALRFGVAFFFALIGLISGAQEQLAKLDVLPGLIAIFLLGFGADTIKNILIQQGTTTAPAAAK